MKWETQIYPVVRSTIHHPPSTIHDHEPRERSVAATAQAGGQLVSLRSWIESSRATASGEA